MTRLTRIRLRDWMPFADVDLDLSDVDSVVVVGENGVGKSALLDAITWAVWDRTRQPSGGEGSSPDMLVRTGADSCLVHLEWRTGTGRTISVTRERFRGRDGKLRMAVDGAEQSHHTIRDTRAAIIRQVGLGFAPAIAGPIMVQAGLYSSSEAADSLMRASPSARKDVLMEAVARGGEWLPLHEEAKARRDGALATARATEQRVADLELQARGREQTELQLSQAREAAAAAEQRVADLDAEIGRRREQQAAISARVERLSTLRAEITRLTASIEGEQQAVERHQRTIVDARRDLDAPEPTIELADPTVHDAEINVAQNKVDAANEARARLAELRPTIDAIQHRIDAHSRAEAQYEAIVGTVPCGAEGPYASCRFLTEKPDPQAIAADAVKLPVLRTEMEEVEPAAAGLAGAQEELAAAQAARRRVEIDNERARSTHARWQQAREAATRLIEQSEGEIERIHARILAETKQLDTATLERTQLTAEAGEAEGIGRELARLAADRANAVSAKQEAERPVRQLEAQLITIQRAADQLEPARSALAETQAEADTYGLLASAFHRDGIPTMLIEEAIPQIEHRANEVLAHLPGDLRVRLVSGRVTQSGSVSDRLDIVVSDAGYEREHIMLSIGQRFRVDLALRVAIGTAIRTLWLDEPLANLDARSRQAFVETLNAIRAQFDLTVVVSHSEDVNHAFPNRIVVERDGAISTAVLT